MVSIIVNNYQLLIDVVEDLLYNIVKCAWDGAFYEMLLVGGGGVGKCVNHSAKCIGGIAYVISGNVEGVGFVA